MNDVAALGPQPSTVRTFVKRNSLVRFGSLLMQAVKHSDFHIRQRHVNISMITAIRRFFFMDNAHNQANGRGRQDAAWTEQHDTVRARH
jgi:hypothetical protein